MMNNKSANGASANAIQWDFSPQTTLPNLLALNARGYPGRVAIREKALGIWQETTWSQLLDEVLAMAAGLEQLGFAEGDTLLILGDNRARLYVGMLAAVMLRGYAMPVYPTAAPDEIEYFANEVTACFALAEDQEQVDKLLELRVRIPFLRHIVFDDPRGLRGNKSEGLLAWESLRETGVDRLKKSAGLREELIGRSRPEDPGVFLHSSGTTGKPKGVVLQQRNALAGVRNMYQANGFAWEEKVLAYLPMAWTGDFALTVAAGIGLRFTINIPERQETVLHDLREIAPTLYLASPRSWAQMLTSIQVRMAESTPLKKRIFSHFIDFGMKVERDRLVGKKPDWLQRVWHRVGDVMVYRPTKDHFGLTRIRVAYTGGEAIGEDTFLFYRALGIDLRQMYGQTESTAVIAITEANEVKMHTVGRPLPGVVAKISDSGEILLQSESIFSGYYKNEEATKAALAGGWLHSGDAGYLEPDGHLVVLGRLGDVVYTAKGERYIPTYLENQLKFSPYIKDVAVLGKERDFLAAMVCIDIETVGHWAEAKGIPYISYADLSQKTEVLELIAAAIRHVNQKLPEAQQTRRFVALHKEFDADDGEITRTGKLRRNVIDQSYAPVIDAIYAGCDTVSMKAQITYDTGVVGVIERTLTIRSV